MIENLMFRIFSLSGLIKKIISKLNNVSNTADLKLYFLNKQFQELYGKTQLKNQTLKMYENSCYLMNYAFGSVKGITLQSNKCHSVVAEFLNSNGF